MKTWEMIKALTENPKKKFRCLNEPQENNIVGINHGNIDWYSNRKFENTYFRINDTLHWDWEEVKEPVDFMTAVKSGGRIKVNHKLINGAGYDDLNTYTSLNCLLYTLAENYAEQRIKDVILNGEWYVE